MKIGDLLEIIENKFLIIADDFRSCGFVQRLHISFHHLLKIPAEFLFSFDQLTYDGSGKRKQIPL